MWRGSTAGRERVPVHGRSAFRSDGWRSRRRVVGCGAVGCVLALLSSCTRAEPKAPPAAAAPVEVQVVQVRGQEVPLVYETVGLSEGSRAVDIRARVEGFLVQRAFQEGARVNEQDLLFQIDKRPFEADLEIGRAQLAQAEARLAAAEREAGRLQSLFDQHSASTKELDDARSELDLARAELRVRKANVAKAELNLGYTTMLSPLTGRIGKTLLNEGALVDAGALLATVTQLDPIDIRFSISEREGLSLRNDLEKQRIRLLNEESLRVSITLIDGTEYGEQGTINYTDVQVDPRTGTAELRAELPNPKEILKPGQFLKVRLHGFVRPNALIVPRHAVQQGPTGAFVYVTDGTNTVGLRPVTMGSWVDQGWVVESGLHAGELVIVGGLQKIQPGMSVRIRDAATSTAPTTHPGKTE